MPLRRLTLCLLLTLILQHPLSLSASLPFSPDTGAGRFVPDGTVVLFDEAHFPVYTVNPDNPSGYSSGNSPRGAYASFAGVLRRAGFTVRTLDYGYYLDSSSLAGVKVLVIVCSQGQDVSGSIRAPYTEGEVDAVVNFVRGGGGLFLIGDHTTFPPAIFPIARRFGISYAQKLLHDPTDFVRNSTTGEPFDMYGDVFIAFERDNFSDHPIMSDIGRVELYRTDYFTALPADAWPLIISDSDTYCTSDHTDTVRVPSPRSVVAAAIPSNGTAGAGRVVVVADTNTFETDENRDDDPDMDLFDSDNELYGLRICEWLADVPPHRSVELASAEKGTEGQREITHNCTQGNSTIFYIRARNTGNVQDTYDFTVEGDRPQSWSHALSHSALTLRSSEERVMTLEVRVPPEAMVGESQLFVICAHSRADPMVSAMMNCTVRVPALHGLSLLCEDNRKVVEAGESAIFQLRLANRGNVEEEVRLVAEGPEGWGAALDASALLLPQGAQRIFNLTVTPPSSALGGEEGKVTVLALLPGAPEASAREDTYARIRQRFGVELGCLEPERGVDPGSVAVFPVSITNLGNGHDDVSIYLSGGCPWRVDLDPTHIYLPYRSSAVVTVVTHAPPLSKANESITISLLAASVRDPDARDSLSLKAVVRRVSRISLNISPPVLHADPGTLVEFRVDALNTGNAPERVRLSASPGASLSVEEAPLEPWESFDSTLAVPVPAEAEAGERLIFTVEAYSLLNASVNASAIAVVVVNQTHRVLGELSPPNLSLYPGERGESLLKIWNEGNGPEEVRVEVEGGAPGWEASADVPILLLERGGRGQCRVVVRPPGGALAATYGVSVTLLDGAGQRLALNLDVTVLRVHNFTLRAHPQRVCVSPGMRASLSLFVENSGNGPETVRLLTAGRHSSWISLEKALVTVNHSSNTELVVSVRPGPDAAPGRYMMRIEGVGEDNSTEEAEFLLVVKESGTTIGDLPCLLGALLVVLGSGLAIYFIFFRSTPDAREGGGSSGGPNEGERKHAGEAPEGVTEGSGEGGSQWLGMRTHER
ncbi:MAG: hypothetical protein QXW06_00755 [Thermoplasmata archaeon]